MGNERDEALLVELKGRKGKGKREVECWGCGEKGHFRRDCPKPEPSDEKDKGDSKAEAANTAESDSECEKAWCMEEDLVMVTSEVPMQGFGPISQISDVQDKGTASSNKAQEEEDWFLKAIEDANELVCQFSNVPDRSMTALVTNSDENQISASYDEAEGEVDWFSVIAEDSDEVSDDGWDLDDELSAGSVTKRPYRRRNCYPRE